MKQKYIKIEKGKAVYFLSADENIWNFQKAILTECIRRNKAFNRSVGLRARLEVGRSAVERKLYKAFNAF